MTFSRQLCQGRFFVGAAHERFADENGVGSGLAQAVYVGAAAYAALRYEEGVLRNERPQAAARIQGHGKVLQVAVIDADDARADSDGPPYFIFIMRFHQS